MTALEFMRLWRKNVGAEDETEIFIELPDGTLCTAADLYGLEDENGEAIKLIISAGQEVI